MVAKRMQKAQIANVLLNDIFHRQDQKVGYSCCSFGIREDITTAPILVSDWFFYIDPLINDKTQLLISWSMKVASILKSTCCWVVPSARSRYRLPPWFVKVASTHRGPSCQQTNKQTNMPPWMPHSALAPRLQRVQLSCLSYVPHCFLVNIFLVILYLLGGSFFLFLILFPCISTFLQLMAFSMMEYNFGVSFGCPGIQSCY